MEKMRALPFWMYGDPADALDRKRAERRKLLQLRKHKARRIQVLVRQVLKGMKR
jgi:hypothetical protein